MKLIAYTRPQQDRSTGEALEAIVKEASVPFILEPGKSRGKSRAPEMHERVIIPRCVFIDCTDKEYYHAMATRAARHIIAVLRVPQREWERQVRPFIDNAAEEVAFVRARLRAGELLHHYKAGEELTIISGPLQGQIMRFIESVGGDDLTARLRGKVAMMGADVPVLVDPLAVKRA